MSEIPAVIHAYVAALKAHDVEAIADTVCETLAFVTATQSLDKRRFLEMLRALYTGFPDWHYDHDAPVWRGDTIAIRWRQGGTHTGVFALPGMEPVPPTSREVTIPEHHFFYRVRGEKIVEIRPEPIPGGAPRGILEQIGVETPPL
jgi:predicted ester cyclase